VSDFQTPKMPLGFFLRFPLAVLGFCLAIAYLLVRRKKHGEYPLPPGPKGLPIIGNLLDMPTSDEWVTFQKWSKDFGSNLFPSPFSESHRHPDLLSLGSDVVHISIFGTHIVILNSAKAASDLLDGRSALYSDRYVPRFLFCMACVRAYDQHRPAMPGLTTL
jgi:hypothetical protein